MSEITFDKVRELTKALVSVWDELAAIEDQLDNDDISIEESYIFDAIRDVQAEFLDSANLDMLLAIINYFEQSFKEELSE